MTSQRVVPSDREAAELRRAEGQTADLIRQAQESDEADRKLTIRQAVKKYKKAVFWALFLSTSLVMEGYDLVMV
jgi:SP family general alpha glucoside:H+ symporter-like MFS transporter